MLMLKLLRYTVKNELLYMHNVSVLGQLVNLLRVY